MIETERQSSAAHLQPLNRIIIKYITLKGSMKSRPWEKQDDQALGWCPKSDKNAIWKTHIPMNVFIQPD